MQNQKLHRCFLFSQSYFQCWCSAPQALMRTTIETQAINVLILLRLLRRKSAIPTPGGNTGMTICLGVLRLLYGVQGRLRSVPQLSE